MKSKREENPGCQNCGFGQTGVQTLASHVSNHVPAGTALQLPVDPWSLPCAGREGVIVFPLLSPTAGASTSSMPSLSDGTKV